jgi:hypothetical protein
MGRKPELFTGGTVQHFTGGRMEKATRFTPMRFGLWGSTSNSREKNPGVKLNGKIKGKIGGSTVSSPNLPTPGGPRHQQAPASRFDTVQPWYRSISTQRSSTKVVRKSENSS